MSFHVSSQFKDIADQIGRVLPSFKRMDTSVDPAAVSRGRGRPRMHANDAERQRNHRIAEMSVVREARLSANAQSQRIRRLNESSAERILRQLEDSHRHQLLRQNENTEQRSIGLMTISQRLQKLH
ncbi:hypothetical protein RB195_002833 [Necator americanus]|uniref:BHLH domain-containing protein n=1 Tax=Necator americanus TaxID=51031 RepID=A0ABR1DKW1_NECAM